MTRAISAISGARPFNFVGNLFSSLWRELMRDARGAYRPERHYMRGPGPAWRAKHGPFPRA